MPNMPTALQRLVLAAAACLCSPLSWASAPTTLAYQGRLADAGGSPINATLNIAFRLYAAPSGGSPLWSETQTGVEVDGGNLAVELGQVVALPRDLWGQQLYLGIQIAGDSEMAPRPRLTAAPFALRAGSTQRRTVIVSAEGTPAANGSALLQTVALVADASASSPVAIELDAGSYDLGTQQLVLPSHTTLIGKGQSATLITSAFIDSANGSATLQLSANTEARQLTARNTGVSSLATDNTFGIAAFGSSPSSPVAIGGVRLHSVTGESIAASGAVGGRAGMYLCVFNSTATEITARASGGQFAMGLRADCPNSGLSIDGALLQAEGGSLGVRGTYLTTGANSRWSRLRVQVIASNSVETAYGIRFMALGSFPSNGPRGVLSDSSVRVSGIGSGTVPTFRVEGITVENAAQIEAIERTLVHLDGVRGNLVSGMRLLDRTSNTPALAALRIRDSEIRVSALYEPTVGVGEIMGLRTEGYPPALHGVRIDVECRSGDVGPCLGMGQPEYWAEPNGAGEWLIEETRLQVGHAGSAGANARAAGLQVMGRARVDASSLRLLRSAGNEPVNLVRWLRPAAQINISGSTLSSSNAADGSPACLFEVFQGPGGSGEWYGNHLQGLRCDGGQVNLVCAGNTLRGSGFLAGSCP